MTSRPGSDEPPPGAPALGEPIHRMTDTEGEVHVYARGSLRLLTLGNAVEQTCIDLDHPARLVHAYTQAMLLGLLLARAPRDALILGLGGGALAQALLAGDGALALDAVERRVAVVEAAHRHLALPRTERLRIQVGDAFAFLRGHGNSYDLAFADLYGAHEMHPDQGTAGFLAACRGRLWADGLLVCNHWSGDFRASRRAQAALQEVFPDRVLSLHVQGGNAIAFAFAGSVPGLRRDAFFASAQALGLRLGIPLQPLARALWGQNAEVLHKARLYPGH